MCLNSRSVIGFFSQVTLVAAVLAAVGEVRAYTPESPEVKQMIQRGLKYLETSDQPALGAKCLIGLAYFKNDYPADHPQIVAAVEACRQACTGSEAQVDDSGTIYSPAIAAIYLCELDPQKYRSEIDKLMKLLLKAQQSGGAWGYSNEPQQGDTSQTQYGVLSLWTAHHAGYKVPLPAIENVCIWLMRTQDVNGGFAYKPQLAGGRIQQGDTTLSLTAAGLGSLYVTSDLLGITAAKEAEPDTGLPPALKVVQDEDPKSAGGKRTNRVDATALRRAQADGMRWLAQNYRIDPPEWRSYYMYGLERCQSFRELVEGSTEEEPTWYNDGVRFLQKTQLADGSWFDGSVTEGAATAFSILFLTRSTQKAIKKTLGEGVLRGGRGLPADASTARVQGGQVVGTPVTRSVDDLLKLLEDPNSGELQNLATLPDQLVIRNDEPLREDTADRLRRLVSNESYEARIVAVRALAQARDLNNVPVLIYALGDPDVRVVKEARDALRFVSRKFKGFGPPDQSTPEEREAAKAAWKQWYLSIRPDAQFLD